MAPMTSHSTAALSPPHTLWATLPQHHGPHSAQTAHTCDPVSLQLALALFSSDSPQFDNKIKTLNPSPKILHSLAQAAPSRITSTLPFAATHKETVPAVSLLLFLSLRPPYLPLAFRPGQFLSALQDSIQGLALPGNSP